MRLKDSLEGAGYNILYYVGIVPIWTTNFVLNQENPGAVCSLSMADVVHGSFSTSSIVCCACKIISSGEINIMEVLSMTNSKVLFPMVYSDIVKLRS